MKEFSVSYILIFIFHFTFAQPGNNFMVDDNWPVDSNEFLYTNYGERQRDPTACFRRYCRLPDCFCAGNDTPRGLDSRKIPQIVMFTFDDAVNEQNVEFYRKLFPKERINPNGCPVSVTFFVSHNWTDYGMVKELHERGHEIASHSITHKLPQSWWRYAAAEDWKTEIAGQRDNLVNKAGIPEEDISGMRSPFLETGGDVQFDVLTEEGFTYDASFMTGPHDKGGAWPFTLDYIPGWQYCTNLNCPQQPHHGLWEVPLNRWVGIDGNPCSMVDACQQNPRHKGEALAYLWQNFNRHYYGNRAPVGVNMHATWFKTDYNFEAMEEFVRTLSEMDDVYIITVAQTLEWIKFPRTVQRSLEFEPWQKTCVALNTNPVRQPNVASPEEDPIPMAPNQYTPDDREDLPPPRQRNRGRYSASGRGNVLPRPRAEVDVNVKLEENVPDYNDFYQENSDEAMDVSVDLAAPPVARPFPVYNVIGKEVLDAEPPIEVNRPTPTELNEPAVKKVPVGEIVATGSPARERSQILFTQSQDAKEVLTSGSNTGSENGQTNDNKTRRPQQPIRTPANSEEPPQQNEQPNRRIIYRQRNIAGRLEPQQNPYPNSACTYSLSALWYIAMACSLYIYL